MKKTKAAGRILLAACLFLSFCGAAKAGYKMEYVLNFGSLRIGEIRLEHVSNTVHAMVRITASGLIDFRQDDLCRLPAGRQGLVELINTTNWGRLAEEKIVFSSSNALYRTVRNNKTNSVFVTNRSGKFTLLSLVHSFITAGLLAEPVHPVFLNGKFHEVGLTALSTNLFSVTDTKGKYRIEVKVKKEKGRMVPLKVDLKKYMMYGINWNMFNCVLTKGVTK